MNMLNIWYYPTDYGNSIRINCIFWQNSTFYWITTYAGVLIFTGLVAYDTQKIKEMYWDADGADIAAKKSIMGAFTLYLDFINLFLMLLRFIGDRR